MRAFTIEVNGKSFIVKIKEIDLENLQNNTVSPIAAQTAVKYEPQVTSETQSNKRTTVLAPMPGVVLKVLVSPGANVAKGDPLLILEAMKMENEILSQLSGTVIEVRVKAADNVSAGDILVVIG